MPNTEYVGASICIRVTKPSLGRTIGSEGFMGGGVGWVGSWCTRLHQWDATVCGGEGWMQPNISSGARGNESQIKTVRFWESFLKRDENAMIHAELNWKGDSFRLYSNDAG